MIEILDLGLNNLTSLRSALGDSTNAKIRVVSSADDSGSPRLLILPGTGSFGAAMQVLRENGFSDVLRRQQTSSSFFLAGICLGAQLLAIQSEESPGVDGLGFVRGSVERLPRIVGDMDLLGRVPHVGWSALERDGGNIGRNSFHFDEKNQGDVYYSHSYHVVLDEPQAEILWSRRGRERFVAAFRKDLVSGYQFHPEKSSKAGQRVISEMLNWAGIEN